MNGFAAWAQGALGWLQTQGSAAFVNLSAVFTNKPEPARQVLIYTAVLIAMAWAVVKIARKVSK